MCIRVECADSAQTNKQHISKQNCVGIVPLLLDEDTHHDEVELKHHTVPLVVWGGFTRTITHF